jgi:hypothetical protein
MNKIYILLVVAVCSLAQASLAQDTNSLRTDIGVFETETGVVLVKGFSLIGTISTGTDVITVLSKETTDINSGHKVDGLAIEIGGDNLPRERILIDYDEIDSLLSNIDYLNTITYDVTPLPSFEASYSTKAGLRVIADSVRREGGIKTYLAYGDRPRILLSSVQLTQFSGLIQQAKKDLDSIRTAK